MLYVKWEMLAINEIFVNENRLRKHLHNYQFQSMNIKEAVIGRKHNIIEYVREVEKLYDCMHEWFNLIGESLFVSKTKIFFFIKRKDESNNYKRHYESKRTV